jgi:nucleotide-binding universal stress UspA family protein
MRLVLVGDDGSQEAAHAVTWATRFASERDARVTVVHVTTTGEDMPASTDAHRVTIHDSHPASALMGAAADLGADLIVLGRRGKGGFPSLPIGSTVHCVAGSCGLPVVVVPIVDLPSEPPLIRRVVVGLDGLPGAANAAAWAAEHCGAAEFTAAHALEQLPALTSEGEESGPELYERAQERAVALMRASWSRHLRDAGIAFDVVVDRGGAADVIVDTAADVSADLVVVGRQDRGPMRGMLGGVSQRVLAYAPCAAAIVQSSTTPS